MIEFSTTREQVLGVSKSIMEKKIGIYQITPFFSPNVGGVETHLLDLTKELSQKYFVRILTYQALVGTKKGKIIEKEKNIEIKRIPWFANVYYKTLKSKFLHFLYLTPRLVVGAMLDGWKNKDRISVIHAHGINAAYAGAILKRLIGKPLVVSMHVDFSFPKRGITRLFLLWPLKHSNKILTLTNTSRKELVSCGIPENKVKTYSYWVDQKVFKPESINEAREKLNIPKNKFVALFVGRLAKEKGIEIVLSLAKKLKNIHFIIAGTGDLAPAIDNLSKSLKNLQFVGKIDNRDLPRFYNSANILLVPSLVKTPKPTFEEGVPRVIIESLSCGTPVIGTDNGGIKEVLERGKVGVVVDSSYYDFSRCITGLSNNTKQLSNLTNNCRNFAVSNFGIENAQRIVEVYEELNMVNKVIPLLESTGDMALKRRTKWVFENIDLKKGDRILDVGCGDGFYLHLLSTLEPKASLTGTDFDERGLESAKRNLKGRNIKLYKGDLMKKLPFKDNSFDKIIMSEVTEHLPNDVRGLKEVYRVLKSGGIACITVPHANYPFMWDPINWLLEHLFDTHIKSGFFAGIWNQHERLYEREEIKKVVEKAGFKLEEQKYITWWCLPFNHYLINIGARILAGRGKGGIAQGADKFSSNEKKSVIPAVYFGISNIFDKLNDTFPVSSGVSVVTLARK